MKEERLIWEAYFKESVDEVAGKLDQLVKDTIAEAEGIGRPYWTWIIKVMLSKLNPHRNPSDGTMSVSSDGSINVNLDFVERVLSADPSGGQIKGVIKHEAQHINNNTFGRRENRHHRLWNVATDYIMNLQLQKGNIPLPDGVLMPKYSNGRYIVDVFEPLQYNIGGWSGRATDIDVTHMSCEQLYDALADQLLKVEDPTPDPGPPRPPDRGEGDPDDSEGDPDDSEGDPGDPDDGEGDPDGGDPNGGEGDPDGGDPNEGEGGEAAIDDLDSKTMGKPSDNHDGMKKIAEEAWAAAKEEAKSNPQDARDLADELEGAEDALKDEGIDIADKKEEEEEPVDDEDFQPGGRGADSEGGEFNWDTLPICNKHQAWLEQIKHLLVGGTGTKPTVEGDPKVSFQDGRRKLPQRSLDSDIVEVPLSIKVQSGDDEEEQTDEPTDLKALIYIDMSGSVNHLRDELIMALSCLLAKMDADDIKIDAIITTVTNHVTSSTHVKGEAGYNAMKRKLMQGLSKTTGGGIDMYPCIEHALQNPDYDRMIIISDGGFGDIEVIENIDKSVLSKAAKQIDKIAFVQMGAGKNPTRKQIYQYMLSNKPNEYVDKMEDDRRGHPFQRYIDYVKDNGISPSWIMLFIFIHKLTQYNMTRGIEVISVDMNVSLPENPNSMVPRGT